MTKKDLKEFKEGYIYFIHHYKNYPSIVNHINCWCCGCYPDYIYWNNKKEKLVLSRGRDRRRKNQKINKRRTDEN